MSGVELIVGAVLGGIPVVLEAINRYQALSRTLQTFKFYSKELRKLNNTLDTQKVRFERHISWVLVAISSEPEKYRRLRLEDNLDWQKLQLNGTCKEQADILQDAFQVWRSSLDEIKGSLTKISSMLACFNNTPTDLTSLQAILKKTKFCLKEKDTKAAIKELRELTQDFCALSAQVLDDLSNFESRNTTSSRHTVSRTKASYWNNLESYRRIRQASEGLYDAFASRWACEGHRQHMASLALNSDCLVTLHTEKSINFKISIASLDNTLEGPLCLEVEYIDQVWQDISKQAEARRVAQIPAVPALNQTLHKYSDGMILDTTERNQRKLAKRPRDPIVSGHKDNKRPKVVRFQDASNGSPGSAAESSQQQAPTEQGTMVDLDRVKDYCRHFNEHRHHPGVGNCIGFFRYSGLCRFYYANWQMSVGSMTLTDIISWIAVDRNTRSLPRATMAHLASSLACAILQYHSTPWLPESWEGTHVQFCGVYANLLSTTDFRRVSPFFKAVLGGPSRSTATAQALPQDASLSANPIARNTMLFRFGIMLLELGYSRPWCTLRKMAMLKFPFAKQTDYHAAVALTRIRVLQDRMGPKYPIIVRKCLGCDFGLGENDMNNEDLQGTFLVDVVNGLQEIENGLLGLKLD